MCTTWVEHDFRVLGGGHVAWAPTLQCVSLDTCLAKVTFSSGAWVTELSNRGALFAVPGLSCVCPGHLGWFTTLCMCSVSCLSPNYPDTWPSSAFTTQGTAQGSLDGNRNKYVIQCLPTLPVTPHLLAQTPHHKIWQDYAKNLMVWNNDGPSFQIHLSLAGIQGSLTGYVVTPQAAALYAHMLSSAKLMLFFKIHLTADFPPKLSSVPNFLVN